ncbi:MAG: hypothetical protein AB8H47_28085 [Bacteroidia bacterium]
MKHLLLLFMLGLFSFCYCYSQNAQVNSDQTEAKNLQSITTRNIMNGSVHTFDYRNETVEGSPYFSEIFRLGTVWMKNGGVKEDIILVFNLGKNQLETQMNGMFIKIPLRIVDRFEIEDSLGVNRHFVVRTLQTEKGESKLMPLEQLYRGKSILYRRIYKEFRKVNHDGSYPSNQGPDQYLDRVKYYLKPAGDLIFSSVRLNRSSWEKVLSNQKSAVKAYIRQESFDIEVEQEAIQLLSYYDSLFE